MGKAWIRPVSSGAVDGVNRVFSTPTMYVSGSVVVYLNGVALDKLNDNNWIELGGNLFELAEAPRHGDSVWVYYRPA